MKKMKSIPLLFFFFVLTLALPATAEDLTLEQAKTKFTTADKALNQVYARAKTTLAEGDFTDLQQDQREWIAYRDYRSEQVAAFDGGAQEGREKLNVEYWSSLAALTEERVTMIEGWMKSGSFAKEWEGVWIDGNGGSLAILENEEGKFVFTLDVVRGPTYHVGHLGGSAEWLGSTARFTIDAVDGEAATWLTFVKRGIKLEVIGENTSPYHGARAYFDGHYVRIAELTDDDRKAILAPAEE